MGLCHPVPKYSIRQEIQYPFSHWEAPSFIEEIYVYIYITYIYIYIYILAYTYTNIYTYTCVNRYHHHLEKFHSKLDIRSLEWVSESESEWVGEWYTVSIESPPQKNWEIKWIPYRDSMDIVSIFMLYLDVPTRNYVTEIKWILYRDSIDSMDSMDSMDIAYRWSVYRIEIQWILYIDSMDMGWLRLVGSWKIIGLFCRISSLL